MGGGGGSDGGDVWGSGVIAPDLPPPASGWGGRRSWAAETRSFCVGTPSRLMLFAEVASLTEVASATCTPQSSLLSSSLLHACPVLLFANEAFLALGDAGSPLDWALDLRGDTSSDSDAPESCQVRHVWGGGSASCGCRQCREGLRAPVVTKAWPLTLPPHTHVSHRAVAVRRTQCLFTSRHTHVVRCRRAHAGKYTSYNARHITQLLHTPHDAHRHFIVDA